MKRLKSLFGLKYLIKLVIILSFFTAFTACNFGEDQMDVIKSSGVIVDGTNNKKPIPNLYIELIYDAAMGDGVKILTTDVTDQNGYFELNGEYNVGFFNLDNWETAYVYTNADKKDTLGNFSFSYADETYKYRTLHLDTFSLKHTVWVVPRIINVGSFEADEIMIGFMNCSLADNSKTTQSFIMPVSKMKTLPPVEIIMDMRLQHWLSFGSRQLATGTLINRGEDIAYGEFILEKSRSTSNGDTLFLDFSVHD